MPKDRRTLYWDAETRSVIDLRRVGLYPYMKHRTTQVTVVRLRLDDGEQVEWRPGDPLPQEILDAFADPEVMICAHNAAFERILLRDILHPRYGWPACPPLERWECTMARARACALPGGLEDALSALGSNVQKDMQGHALMLRMCRPRAFLPDGTPTWWEDEDRMRRLSDYCGTDVDGTRALDLRLPPMPDSERAIWLSTERMNDAGVRFDLRFVLRALEVADIARERLDWAMAKVTDGQVNKASNVAALKRFLINQGVDLTPPPDPFADPVQEAEEDEADATEEEALPELRRKDVQRLLLDDRVQDAARKALEIRLEAGKSSTKKLNAIVARADHRGYVRGLISYHGTNTGRDSAAGGGVQIQNFPRETEEDWAGAWDAMQRGIDDVEMFYGPALDVISRMLRGAIIPDDGCEITSVDYSAVELCGVAWLAGQDDLVEDLRKKAKIYERMAGRIYGIDPATVAKDSRERWIGKQVILGCGYQMGYQKFWRMCLGYGQRVDVDLADRAVRTYRDTYTAIPALWYELNDAAMLAVRFPGRLVSAAQDRIRFKLDGIWLRMRLPSGRVLRYAYPKIEIDERFDREGIVYWGVHPKTKRWGKQRTFGGRITENAVQGLCRDLLMDGARRLERSGIYRPTTRVHDETVVNRRLGQGSIAHMQELLCELPAWAGGFPLTSEGWTGERYG